MFQNLGDDRVRDVLLALSVGAMFLYGFYVMKKVDEFIEEIQKSRRGHDKIFYTLHELRTAECSSISR